MIRKDREALRSLIRRAPTRVQEQLAGAQQLIENLNPGDESSQSALHAAALLKGVPMGLFLSEYGHEVAAQHPNQRRQTIENVWAAIKEDLRFACSEGEDVMIVDAAEAALPVIPGGRIVDPTKVN